jgi:hypothetical protein
MYVKTQKPRPGGHDMESWCDITRGVRVRANIRKVPAHERYERLSNGTTETGKISAEI